VSGGSLSVVIKMQPHALPALAAQVERLGTLGALIPWGLALAPPWTVVEVVVQDEYTHDVVFAPDGAATGPALVLDCT
jgi:hypothetical protein